IVGMAMLVTRNAATSAIASLAASSGTIGPGLDRTASAGPAGAAAARSSGGSAVAATIRSSDTARVLAPVRPLPVAVGVARPALAPGGDEAELLGRAGLEDAARLGQRHAPDRIQLGDDHDGVGGGRDRHRV